MVMMGQIVDLAAWRWEMGWKAQDIQILECDVIRQQHNQLEMLNTQGLIYCSNQFSTNPFCVSYFSLKPSKLIELLITTTILCFLLYDMVIRYRQERQVVNIFFVLCSLMIVSLVCNFVYCLDHDIHEMGYFEDFFYSMYFTAIVYYVGLKLVQVMQVSKVWKYVLHCMFGLGVLFNVTIVIEKEVNGYRQCQEIWYLIVDGYAILLSVALTCIGVSYTRKQEQKIEGIDNPVHYKNPLPYIWIWISVNILSQTFGFTETTTQLQLLISRTYITKDYTTNSYVKLIFAFLSFQMGMIATIVFFRTKYKREMENIQNRKSMQDHVRKASVQIELMEGIDVTSL